MKENIIALSEVVNACAAAIATQPYTPPGWVDVMDVVWWQTGLSPTKYEAVPCPNMLAWRIQRRERNDIYPVRVGG